MNKIIAVFLLLPFVFTSCKHTEEEMDKLKIAKQYYTVLDNSDYYKLKTLIVDSLFTKDDIYEQMFTLKEYEKWMQWDSVFHPTYTILKIEKENNMVRAKISKIDNRIAFLHKAPIVTNEILQFKENKISSIKRNTLVFDAQTFVKNRDSLLNFIHKTHPELNGFLHDQTKPGGIKYLKAIELFNNQK